jgi:hypothetical protein
MATGEVSSPMSLNSMTLHLPSAATVHYPDYVVRLTHRVTVGASGGLEL